MNIIPRVRAKAAFHAGAMTRLLLLNKSVCPSAKGRSSISTKKPLNDWQTLKIGQNRSQHNLDASNGKNPLIIMLQILL
jgi:hypothetical protein